MIELFKYFFVIFTVTYFANRVYSFIDNHSIQPFSSIPGLWNFAMVFLAVGAILYCALWEKMSLRQIGILTSGVKESIVNYCLGLGYGFLIISLITVLLLACNGIDLYSNFSNVKWLRWVIILISYFIQGFGEEVLFRGAFLLSLVRKNNLIISVLITSLYFSLWHHKTSSYGVLPFINLFLFGVFCSLCVIIYDNIWAASAFHASWNFFQSHIFGINVSGSKPNANSTLLVSTVKGSDILSGGNYGIEGSLITSVILSVAIGLFLFHEFKRNKLKNRQQEIL